MPPLLFRCFADSLPIWGWFQPFIQVSILTIPVVVRVRPRRGWFFTSGVALPEMAMILPGCLYTGTL